MKVIFWALVFFVSCMGLIYIPVKIAMMESKSKYIWTIIAFFVMVFLTAFSGAQIVQILE